MHNGNEVFVPRFGLVDFRAECPSKEPFSNLWEPTHCTTGEHFRQSESRGPIGFERYSFSLPQVKWGVERRRYPLSKALGELCISEKIGSLDIVSRPPHTGKCHS